MRRRISILNIHTCASELCAFFSSIKLYNSIRLSLRLCSSIPCIALKKSRKDYSNIRSLWHLRRRNHEITCYSPQMFIGIGDAQFCDIWDSFVTFVQFKFVWIFLDWRRSILRYMGQLCEICSIQILPGSFVKTPCDINKVYEKASLLVVGTMLRPFKRLGNVMKSPVASKQHPGATIRINGIVCGAWAQIMIKFFNHIIGSNMYQVCTHETLQNVDVRQAWSLVYRYLWGPVRQRWSD